MSTRVVDPDLDWCCVWTASKAASVVAFCVIKPCCDRLLPLGSSPTFRLSVHVSSPGRLRRLRLRLVLRFLIACPSLRVWCGGWGTVAPPFFSTTRTRRDGGQT